jgi:hypothetical protein
MNGLEIVIKYVIDNDNPDVFEFLKSISEHYRIEVNNEAQQNLEPALEKGYTEIVAKMEYIIHNGGLVA